jgi:uroporphyrinogen-III synthase
VNPLDGWTVAVTAERRADEQADMLRSRGATVVHMPTVATTPADADVLRARTRQLVAHPPAVVVANTATGMRAWMAAALSWGMGDELRAAWSSAAVVARGAKAAGALLSEGVTVAWQAPTETLSGVLDYLVTTGVSGRRVAVQLHGGDQAWFSDALATAGADVVDIPIYRWVTPPVTKTTGDVDAVTFTSPPAVAGLLAADPALPERARDRDLVFACVGPVTAGAAADAGLPNVVVATPSRLGSLVRVLSDAMESRRMRVNLDGADVVVQGNLLTTSDTQARLTRIERNVLVALTRSRGAVLSRRQLADAAWAGDANDHAVVTAVNRLRRKLGPAAPALETASRRGYRLRLCYETRTSGDGP